MSMATQSRSDDLDASPPSRNLPAENLSSATAPSQGAVELDSIASNGAQPALSLAEDIMQCARLGEIALLEKMFEAGRYTAQYKDAEDITPLHWAAISNQYATCEFLIKAGADVNAKGGESGATPAMWAAQRCHYYVVNLLLRSGTDPLLVDGQGYNILHLATIDGNAYLLVLLLHQEIPVDVTDPQGHTSLMWAAYRGYPACVDLLLRWGANVNAVDEKGLNPLHWALVKGSVPCIQKMIEFGVDRFAATTEGKTPSVVAEEMKSTSMWHHALSERGYKEDGHAKTLPLGLTSYVKDRQIIGKVFFLAPTLILWIVFSVLSSMPIYAGLPIALVAAFVLQRGVQLLGQWGPPEFHNIQRTSFLAGVFAGSLFWVGFRWLFYLLPTTFGSHPFYNLLFAISAGSTTYFFTLAMLEDPGHIPKLASRSSQKKVMEELFGLWKFDEQNFCIHCMIRKPLRSKHCKLCRRCVAKHDHHCPWLNNCVANNNLRHFVMYILSLEVGVIVFIRLGLAYIEALPSPGETASQCNILPTEACDLILRDTWMVVLTIYVTIQLIWLTMLIVMQLYQISRNKTTWETMQGHTHHQSGPPRAHPTAVSGAPGLGPQGPHGHSDGSKPRAPRRDGWFAQWQRLLGLDAVVATAADASTTRTRKRGNPFSRGIIVNCKDFWLDPAPYFGRRQVGDSLLAGEVVNYARMYDTPLRTRATSGFRYRQVEDGEVT